MTPQAGRHHRGAWRRFARGPLGLQRGDRGARRRGQRHPADLGRRTRDGYDAHRLSPPTSAPPRPRPRQKRRFRCGRTLSPKSPPLRPGCRAASAARCRSADTRLTSAARALPRPDELLALVRQRFDSAAGRLVQALRANTREHQSRLNRVAPRLSLAPMRTVIANERRRSICRAGGRSGTQARRRVPAPALRRRGEACWTRCPTSPCCAAVSLLCATRRGCLSIRPLR